MQAARERVPKKQCGLHLGQAKAANKKTFTRLGKGLAYNASVAGRTGNRSSVLTILPQRRRLMAPPKLLPFGGNVSISKRTAISSRLPRVRQVCRHYV